MISFIGQDHGSPASILSSSKVAVSVLTKDIKYKMEDKIKKEFTTNGSKSKYIDFGQLL